MTMSKASVIDIIYNCTELGNEWVTKRENDLLVFDLFHCDKASNERRSFNIHVFLLNNERKLKSPNTAPPPPGERA